MKENSEKLKLIDGVFTDAEAKDILMNVFLSKIKFHERRDFSHQERFGRPDEHAAKRIAMIRSSIDAVQVLLSDAKKNNRSLRIVADVNISFDEE
jgi:hypothetical protein